MNSSKLYRITYLISPQLDTEKATQVSQQLTSFIRDKKGKIQEEKELVKKNLAYPIQKDHFAYLGDLVFTLNTADLSSFEKFVSSQKDIIRFLLINHKPIVERPLRSKQREEKDLKRQEKITKDESVDQKLNKILED